MRKKQRGKILQRKSLGESRVIVQGVKQFARVEFAKVMVRNSTMSDSTVEAVSITFRLVLLVAQQIGVANHLGLK